MSSNPPPPRRFAPTPIETTAKSSRQPTTQDEPNRKPRRFAPELVEETSKPSTDGEQKNEEKSKPKPRKFAVEPVEHSVKTSKDVAMKDSEDGGKAKPRRFAPQAVEETQKSSKDKGKPGSEEEVKPKPRRFAPQMVEDTQKSSKDRDLHVKPHVKFKPEPVSTTYGGNRKKQSTQDSDISMASDDKGPRKFTPILLDTARRSRKAGDSKPAISQSDKTEYAYHLHHTEHWKRVNEERAGPSRTKPAVANAAADDDEDDNESDRLSMTSANHSSQLRGISPLDGSAPKNRPSCLAPARQHSFRMPDLDTIESSESERDSSPSPLSSSPPAREGSPITASESSYEHFKHATRIRESFDENFTHYLLDLERKKARQRLEEQALAAYPNPDFGYVAPDHYINNDDDSVDEIEDRPVTWEGNEDDEFGISQKRPARKDSSGSDWEQQEMQRHAEQLQQERNANRITVKASESPWWKPHVPGAENDDGEPKSELKSMRDRARPPMLGADIVFPRCPSPEPTRFDVTQSPATLRNQMWAEAAAKERRGSDEEGGLWSASNLTSPTSPIAVTQTPVNSPSTAKPQGLWGGFCVKSNDTDATSTPGLAPPNAPTGILTPRTEISDPFDLESPPRTPRGHHLKTTDLSNLNTILSTEADFEASLKQIYPDSFITQVYNYLSLGYPSLARPFDEELSKISGISIAELREDDKTAKASPRGYIRLGQDFEGGGGEGEKEDGCVRWRALKRYVFEWARQERSGAWGDAGGGNFGTGVRRGSWAF